MECQYDYKWFLKEDMMYLYMTKELFSKYIDMLIDEGDDYRKIGESDEYCNSISIPLYGIELLEFSTRNVYIVDNKKYMLFLLRYR